MRSNYLIFCYTLASLLQGRSLLDGNVHAIPYGKAGASCTVQYRVGGTLLPTLGTWFPVGYLRYRRDLTCASAAGVVMTSLI